MGITLLGMIFVPICLYYWRSPPRLLELILIGSVFSAAATVVIGGFGVSPGLVPTLLLIGFIGAKLIFGTRYPGERLVLNVLTPFMAVCALGLVSAILMPRLFEGEILVWPQKAETFWVITPLVPNSGNITQAMYLLVSALLTVLASLYITKSGLNLRRLLDAYFISGLMVVFISIWQFFGNQFHVWFPSDFFLSNPGWALLSNEYIGSYTRLSGPFSEPSGLAGYMAGSIAASAWVVLNGHKGLMPRLLLPAGILVLILSTSTTGYAAFSIMLGIATAYTVILGTPGLRARLALWLSGAAIVAVLLAATIPVVAPGVASIAETVITGTANKKQSLSYSDRSATDHDSVTAMWKSGGLGVGWGSNRSSSLIPGLLAAVGLWGVAGLAWFILKIMHHVIIAQRMASEEQRMVMRGTAAGLSGTLITSFISGPTINSPDFYMLVALLIGTAARVRLDAKAKRIEIRQAQLTNRSQLTRA
jgi:hypothetical protein